MSKDKNEDPISSQYQRFEEALLKGRKYNQLSKEENDYLAKVMWLDMFDPRREEVVFSSQNQAKKAQSEAQKLSTMSKDKFFDWATAEIERRFGLKTPHLMQKVRDESILFLEKEASEQIKFAQMYFLEYKKVDLAESFKEAKEKIKKNHYDLVHICVGKKAFLTEKEVQDLCDIYKREQTKRGYNYFYDGLPWTDAYIMLRSRKRYLEK